MDRCSKVTFCFVMGVLIAGTAGADSPTRGFEDSQYPESRFGQAAADPKDWIDSQGFVARELAKPANESERGIASVSSPTAVLQSTVQKRSGIQEVSLIAGDLGFFPKTLFVTKDIPVRVYLTSSSKQTLCFILDSFQVRKQVRASQIQEVVFTPTIPGSYRFYCPVNGMEGNLVVKELMAQVGN